MPLEGSAPGHRMLQLCGMPRWRACSGEAAYIQEPTLYGLVAGGRCMRDPPATPELGDAMHADLPRSNSTRQAPNNSTSGHKPRNATWHTFKLHVQMCVCVCAHVWGSVVWEFSIALHPGRHASRRQAPGPPADRESTPPCHKIVCVGLTLARRPLSKRRPSACRRAQPCGA